MFKNIFLCKTIFVAKYFINISLHLGCELLHSIWYWCETNKFILIYYIYIYIYIYINIEMIKTTSLYQIILISFFILSLCNKQQLKNMNGTSANIFFYLGPDWCNCSCCGCSCGSLRMRVVAVLSGFKRFVWLILWLEIGAFAGYLWLVNHQIQHQLNNKLTIFTFYIIIKILKT